MIPSSINPAARIISNPAARTACALHQESLSEPRLYRLSGPGRATSNRDFMVRSSSSSWRDSSGGSATASTAAGAAPALTLDRVIGQTCLHNTALAVNPITGDVAYPAGCVVVVYQPRRNRQFRYFRASKAVSCLAFSRDGGMLAIGERGHQPSATVWSLTTGAVVRELAGGHRFGIACILFTPSGGGVVTMGFKQDRMLRVWDLRLTARLTGDRPSDESPDRSASSVSGYPSSGPDSPPPPPPPQDSPNDTRHQPDSTATMGTAPNRENIAFQVASARLPQRVRAMDFTSDGECLVTCGDSHVKFWTMTGDRQVGGGKGGFLGIGADPTLPDHIPTAAMKGASSPTAKNGVEGGGGGEDRGRGDAAPFVRSLEGWVATVVDELKGATFVDVSSSGKCGGDGDGSGVGTAGASSVFCVTSKGVLCAFTRGGVLEHWVSLEAPAAYGVSVHDDGTLAAACADGIVRLFKADNLQYITSLPRPPPLGRANISSVRELQHIADLSAAAARAASAAAWNGCGTGACADSRHSAVSAAEENDTVNVGTMKDENIISKASNGVGCRTEIRYPAALGCRLSPSGTKVVCIYADRGLFIWDVTDPSCIGKYRSFLAHGGCIWDVQRMPARIPMPAPEGGGQPPPPPNIPAGGMVTCSADNTVRVWDLDALDGKSAEKQSHSGRWTNIYSKHLLRVLYGSGNGTTGYTSGSLCPRENEGDEKQSRNEGAERHTDDEATAEEMALSEGGFDPETPHKSEWSQSPRSLAVHPNGSQVACGDKAGNIRVYDLSAMELIHSQSAHDGEVLCLAYSPMMIPVTSGISTTALPQHARSIGGNVTDKIDNAVATERKSGTEVFAAAISPSSLCPTSVDNPSSAGEARGTGALNWATIGGMARSVSSWDAVDPLDPAGAAEKMLSLSSMPSTVQSATEFGVSRVGAGVGIGGHFGQGGGQSHDRRTGAQHENPETLNSGSGGVRLDAILSGQRQNQRDCCPLVLLASASRDRLVHVFDASTSYVVGGGGHGDGPVSGIVEATAVSPPRENGTADDNSGKVEQEVGRRAEGEEITQSSGAEREESEGTKKLSQGARGSTRVAAGLPLLKTLNSHAGSVTAVKFSKDGKRLITAGGDKLLVLNAVKGPNVHRLRAVSVPQGTIYGLDVDPTNNYIVTAGQDKRLNIWSTTSGKHVRAYRVEPSAPTPITAPTTPAEAEGGGGELSRGSKIRGRTSAEGGRGTRGDGGGELFKVDLDPTGMYAAACSFDKWIRLFDFYSGKCLAKVAGHSELATGVRFTPDGRRLVTTGGDGVMFVWQLSSELQQSMHDRMCELRPGAADTAGLSHNRGASDGDRVRSDSNSGLYSASSAKAPVSLATPLSARVPNIAVEKPAYSVGSVVDQVVRKGSELGTHEPHTTPSKAPGEARARAKADAKARLKFQRYQLPAWAHTQSGRAIPTTTSATSTTGETTNSRSPMLEKDASSVGSSAEEAIPDDVQVKHVEGGFVGGARDNTDIIGGAAGKDVGDIAGEAAENGGVDAEEGRESPPPLLEALVSGSSAIGDGSFSFDGRNSNSKDGGKDCDAVDHIKGSSKQSDTSFSVGRRGGGRRTNPPPPQSPPPSKEEKERREQECTQEEQRGNKRVSEAQGALSTAGSNPSGTSATTASGSSRPYKGLNPGGGGTSANPRARWGGRQNGKEPASNSAEARRTVGSWAVKRKGDVLVAARGRWMRRSVQEEGGMEVVGHRTGSQRIPQEKSRLLVTSAGKRSEEMPGSGTEAHAKGLGVGKRVVDLVECREEEDGVMLGGSEVEDDDDDLEYSVDDDFEDVSRTSEELGKLHIQRKPDQPYLDAGVGGSSVRGPEESCGDHRGSPRSTKLDACVASDPADAAPEQDLPSERDSSISGSGNGHQEDGSGEGDRGSPQEADGAVTAATAAEAVGGQQRRMTEATENSTTCPTVASGDACVLATADVPPKQEGRGVEGDREMKRREGSAGVDGGPKLLPRGSSLRARSSGFGGSFAAATPGGRGGLPSSAVSSGSSASSAADQRDEDATARGRRISETEGVVEAMRKKLSAMGFLEADSSGPSGENIETAVTTAKSHGDLISQAPGEAAKKSGLSAASVSAAEDAAEDAAESAADIVAAAADDPAVQMRNVTAHVCAMGGEDEDNSRGRNAETPSSPSSPARQDGGRVPPPLPPPPPPRRRGSPRLSKPGGGRFQADVAAQETSACPSVDASGSSPDSDEYRSPSSPKAADTKPPAESGSSVLSSGRLRCRRRRTNAPTPRGEGRGRDNIVSSPPSDRAVVLPRPDAEYEAALVRLTEAASHAAELYRELAEASSASCLSRRTGAGTSRGGGSVSDLRSFPLTSSTRRERTSLGLEGACRGDTSGGNGLRQGEKGSGRIGDAASAFALSSSPAGASTSIENDVGEGVHHEESYDEDDDDEWEGEEDDAGEIDPEIAARRRREEGRLGGGTVGALSLEQSFRESFASVNDVLSTIASSGAAVANSGTGSGRIVDGRRDPESSPSLRGEMEHEKYFTTGSPASPLSPPSSRIDSRRTRSSGFGVSDFELGGAKRAFPLESLEGRRISSGSAVPGLGGVCGVESGEPAMPAEVSGMLHRYSEMMLRVVQEKMEARIADRNTRPGT